MGSEFGYIHFIEIAAQRIAEDILAPPYVSPRSFITGSKFCIDYGEGQVIGNLKKMGFKNLEVRAISKPNGTPGDFYNLDEYMEKIMPKREIIGY